MRIMHRGYAGDGLCIVSSVPKPESKIARNSGTKSLGPKRIFRCCIGKDPNQKLTEARHDSPLAESDSGEPAGGDRCEASRQCLYWQPISPGGFFIASIEPKLRFDARPDLL